MLLESKACSHFWEWNYHQIILYSNVTDLTLGSSIVFFLLFPFLAIEHFHCCQLEGKNNIFCLLWEIRSISCKTVSLFHPSNMGAMKTFYIHSAEYKFKGGQLMRPSAWIQRHKAHSFGVRLALALNLKLTCQTQIISCKSELIADRYK